MLCYHREIKAAGSIPKGDVKQQILVLMSQPGNLQWDAKEAFKLDPGVPRSPEEVRLGAFLDEILWFVLVF